MWSIWHCLNPAPGEFEPGEAKWQRGHAAVCNAVDVGSSPTFASRALPRRSVSAEVQRQPDPVSSVEVGVFARGGELAREKHAQAADLTHFDCCIRRRVG